MNTSNKIKPVSPSPFLKWAGGKRGLLHEIAPRIPDFPGRYIEPFLGAGAVLFTQQQNKKKIVNDFNPDLIEVYEAIRDSVDELLVELRKFTNTKEAFLKVRERDRSLNFLTKWSKVQRAARFIYLNKTCFNGLYRVNSQGFFNVPYGYSKNPDWINEANLRAVSDFLNFSSGGKQTTKFLSGDYKGATKLAKPGDFVYFDPPYDPVSPTASFVAYQKAGFTADDQEALRDEVVRLTAIGIPILLSNSETKFINDLYKNKKLFRINHVSVNRAISAKTSGRGSIGEVLVDNFMAVGAKLK